MENYAEHEMIVHTFGAKPSPCVSAFTLRFHGERMSSQISEQVLRAFLENFHVDDYLDSFKSVAEARKVRIELTETCGFDLVKWKSNYKSVLEEERVVEDEVEVQNEEVKVLKIFEDGQVFEKSEVLGVSYSFEKDVFSMRVSDRWKELVMISRQMMGLTLCVFDSLGFFCPFILLFHEATNLGLEWDDPLPEKIRKEFDK
jgi:hypothetical protein